MLQLGKNFIAYRTRDLTPPLIDQRCDERAPSGLVGSSYPGPVVAVIKLVEKNQVLPISILLDSFAAAVYRAIAIGIAGEDANHAIGDLGCDLKQVHVSGLAAGDTHAELVTKTSAECPQRLDDQERRGKPDGPPPVGVPTLDLVVGFGRLVSHLGVAEDEWMLLVEFGQAADAELG